MPFNINLPVATIYFPAVILAFSQSNNLLEFRQWPLYQRRCLKHCLVVLFISPSPFSILRVEFYDKFSCFIFQSIFTWQVIYIWNIEDRTTLEYLYWELDPKMFLSTNCSNMFSGILYFHKKYYQYLKFNIWRMGQ